MPGEKSERDVIEGSIQQFQKPGDPDYHNNLGIAHRKRGDLEGAIREYREAIRLKPNDVIFHCNLASVCAEKGEYQQAFEEYEQALRLAPGDYHTHFNLGNLLHKVGRMDEAAAEYQRAIQQQPERAEAHYGLANCYWEQKRRAEAVSHYDRALAADPTMSIAGLAHLRVGLRYLDERSLEKAETHLLEALRRRPDDFMTNYGLAVVYLNMQHNEVPPRRLPAKALLHAQKAVELDADDEDAKRLVRAALAAVERTK